MGKWGKITSTCMSRNKLSQDYLNHKLCEDHKTTRMLRGIRDIRSYPV